MNFSLEILDKKEMSIEEKKELLKNSLLNNINTISITKEYLEFVKFKSEKSLNIAQLNIYKLLNEVRNDLDSIIKEKFINVYIEKNSTKIEIDKFWLKKAIHYIFLNVMNYRENGSVNMYIETTFSGVYISVSSIAKGAKRKKLKSMFRLFEEIDEKSKDFGVELGLAKYIIDSFNGSIIKVQSNATLGSDFIIYLPKKTQKTTIKKIAFSVFGASLLSFLVLSYYPIYTQKYTKAESSGYEIYNFEDGSIAKFKKNSDYEISSYKNLYNTKYSIQSSIKRGEIYINTIKSKVSIKVGDRKFKNFGTNFAILKNDNKTKLAVFDGIVKSDKMMFNKGNGAIFTKQHFKQVKLLPAVRDIKFDKSYLSFKSNSNAVQYHIIISSNNKFSDVVDSFYTLNNRDIKLNLKYDTQYFLKIFEFDKNGLPSNPKIVQYINLSHYNKALELIKNNYFKEAMLELKSSILTINNYSSLPYFEIAKLYFSEKKYYESIKYISKAIKIEEKLDYYLLLFDCYYEIDKIIDIKNKIDYILNKYPKHLDVLYFKSILLYKNGDYKKSQKYLFKILQLKPHYKNANHLMGEILEKQGKEKLAIYYRNLEN
jgi:tetratricopeptide (TPR) repeat protein